MRFILSLLCLLLLFGAPAAASDELSESSSIDKLRRIRAQVELNGSVEQPQPMPQKTEEASSFSGRVFQGLSLCLGLFFVMVYFLKRTRRDGSDGAQRSRLMLRERISVGPKSNVALIAVDGRELLVGVSESGVTLLHELPKKRPAQSPISLKPSQALQCAQS